MTDADEGTLPLVTVTVDTTVSPLVQEPSLKRWYVTLPPAVLVAPDSVAESVTELPTVMVVAERVVDIIGLALLTISVVVTLSCITEPATP